MIFKPCMQHLGLMLYKVINDDPGLTLTYFMARSNLVAYEIEFGKLTKSFKGKNLQQMTKLTDFIFMKKI